MLVKQVQETEDCFIKAEHAYAGQADSPNSQKAVPGHYQHNATESKETLRVLRKPL